MAKSKFILLLLSFSLVTFFSSFAEDTLTITTYYPSPYGNYRELRAKRIAIGDNYIQGGTYDWEESDSDGGEIDYAADLVVEGNVGIGTTSPGVKLDVRGEYYGRHDAASETIMHLYQKNADGYGMYIRVDNNDTDKYALNVAPNSGTSALYVQNNGNVGIGTTSPSYGLDVAGTFGITSFGSHYISSGGTGVNSLKIRNTTSGTGNYSGLSVGNDSDAELFNILSFSSTYTTSGANIASGTRLENNATGGLTLVAGNPSGVINFFTGGETSAKQRMIINASGYVGIGTTSPAATLQVKGTMKVFGDWESKSTGTIYQASTDGFVVGYFTGTSGSSTLTGYTDANSSPVTLVVYDFPETDDRPCSFIFPVRKGDYWVVRASNGTAVVRWLPLGTS